jgi:hypothetical protein
LGSGAIALLIGAGLLLIVSHWQVGEHGQTMTFKLPSYLQPLMHLIAAAGCAAAALTQSLISDPAEALQGNAARPSPGSMLHRMSRRVAVLVLFAGVLLAISLPLAGEAIWAGLTEWLARRDPWLAGVAEFQPVFPSWALWRLETWRGLHDFNALPGLLAPVVFPIGLWRAHRAHRAVGTCFAAWTLCLIPLTLMQIRFGQILSANYAVCLALSLGFAAEKAHHFVSPRFHAMPRPAVVLFACLAALYMLDPAIRDELRWHESRDPTAVEAVSLFLANDRQQEEIAGAQTQSGVLANWEHGHTLLRVGERPVLTAGFGPYTGEQSFQDAEDFMYQGEAALLELMTRRRLRYVVTGMRAAFPDPADRPGELRKPFVFDPIHNAIAVNSAYFVRFPLTSLIVGGTGMPDLGIAHVSHLMPRFVSAQQAGGLGFPLHRLWLFERVSGARLVGEAAPGARIEARTSLVIRGAQTQYIAWCEADERGRFELTVPLANNLQSSALATGGDFTIWIDGEASTRVTLSETAIRAGTRLAILGATASEELAIVTREPK